MILVRVVYDTEIIINPRVKINTLEAVAAKLSLPSELVTKHKLGKAPAPPEGGEGEGLGSSVIALIVIASVVVVVGVFLLVFYLSRGSGEEDEST